MNTMRSGFRSGNGGDGDDYDDDNAEEEINFSRYRSILGAVAKLPLYVRPSVRLEQLGSHWTDFHEKCVFFEKLSIEI